MPSLRTCAECGSEQSSQALEGLCPKCMVRVSFPEDLGAELPEPKGGYFGDYELLEEIARGGMGVVYKARQLSLNRLVALKMIAAGRLATPQEVERLHTETRAVALLDHPNIVPIYQVGEESGVHYFSMKLIEGASLAQRIGEFRLAKGGSKSGLREKASSIAQLVAHVARAIHYAHQRGILHRDLKPGNILLDPVGQPYVTDFGLAKLLENGLDLTRTRTVLGTPAYMAPEQAAGQARHLTTAADVYSLGAILYELLTGRPPFFGETDLEVLQKVQEQEPERPTRSNRAIEPDLETICLKCLQKEPALRYGSAEALAHDLERWRAGEAIQARPSTVMEKTWRWCRRKPGLTSLAATTLLLLLTVLIGAPIAAWREARLRHNAEVNEQTAQSEATKSRQVAQFLRDMLRGVRPSVARGRDVAMLLEILDNTVKRLDRDLRGQPEVEAELRIILGKTYQDLGRYADAQVMAQEALRLRKLVFGAVHPAVGEALNSLGEALYYKGDLAGAEAVGREALTLRTNLCGPVHADVADALNTLANVLQTRHDLAGAESMHRQALAIRREVLPPGHANIAGSLNNLANVLQGLGDAEGAEPLYREALVIFEKRRSRDPLSTERVLHNLGILASQRGDLTEAERVQRQVLAIRRKHLEPDHPNLAVTLTELAMVLLAQGNLVEAESKVREAMAKKPSRTNDWRYTTTLSTLASVLSRKGDLIAAEAKHREALSLRKQLLGEDHPLTRDSFTQLSILAAARGDLAEAGTNLRRAIALKKPSRGDELAGSISGLMSLSWVSSQQGDAVQAEALKSQALSLSLQRGPYGVWALLSGIYDLSGLLRVQGKFAEAEPLLQQAFEYLQSRRSVSAPFERDALERLARFYEEWGKPESAAQWRRKLAETPAR